MAVSLTLDVGMTLVALAALNAWLGVKFGDRKATVGLSLACFFLSQVFMFASLVAIGLISTSATEAALTTIGWNLTTLLSLLYSLFTIYIVIKLLYVGFDYMAGSLTERRMERDRIR